MTPARPRRPWTEEDDDELRRRLGAREPLSVVATAMGRTMDGIRGRAATLRLKVPARNRPWRIQGGTTRSPDHD